MKKLVRLAKLMSQRGLCSRREAEKFIDLEQVLVDGKIVARQGTKVPFNAEIRLLKKASEIQRNKVTILLNKPVGIVSAQPEKAYIAAIELINSKNHIKEAKKFHVFHKKKLAVVGRLDIDSKGLLVFTQDGVLAKKIIGPDSDMEKEYLVRVHGEINEEKIKKLTFGLKLDGKALKKATVRLLQKNLLKFVLKEGKKRQIRRMCEMVGLKVISLKRVRIGKVLLKDLPLGKWRYLKEDEEF